MKLTKSLPTSAVFTILLISLLPSCLSPTADLDSGLMEANDMVVEESRLDQTIPIDQSMTDMGEQIADMQVDASIDMFAEVVDMEVEVEDASIADMYNEFDMEFDMEPVDTSDMLTACAEPLTVSPNTTSVLPFSLVTFVVEGGQENFALIMQTINQVV